MTALPGWIAEEMLWAPKEDELRRLRQTHTYAILEVSGSVYEEVRKKLEEADYRHAFHQEGGRKLIDMHGIALARPRKATTPK